MSKKNSQRSMSCDEKTANLLAKQATMYEAELNNNDTSAMLKNFLDNTAKILSCGPSCQKKKKSNALLKKYQRAQIMLFQGPDNLEDTANNYYAFSRGSNYARDFEEKKMREVADKIANEYLSVFDDIANTSQTLATFYESNKINLNNTQELEYEFDKQHKTAEREYYDSKNEATTSDRKAYYEDQEIDNLVWWNNIYYYMYLIILVAFFVSAFLVNTQTPFKRIAVIFTLLVLWLFVGKYVFRQIARVMKSLGNMGPKNIYLGL